MTRESFCVPIRRRIVKQPDIIDRVTNKENLEASNELFAQVVAEAHKRGMKVILDGVFNHCGSFNKWLDAEQIYERSGDYEPGGLYFKGQSISQLFPLQ